MGLIIPVKHLSNELPENATDEFDALSNAVAEASALVNTWAINYFEFDAYTGPDSNDLYTINAPPEIARICKQIAKHLYWQGVGQVYRDGEENIDHEARLDYYMLKLRTIQVEPVSSTVTVSLDSEGYQLIARNQEILTHNASITSATTNVWNLGEHFRILRGGVLDADSYFTDGWYLDGSNETSTLEGTLTYWRTYRNDTFDYMRTTTTRFGRR